MTLHPFGPVARALAIASLAGTALVAGAIGPATAQTGGSGKPPAYAGADRVPADAAVALWISDPRGGSFVYAPCVPSLTGALLDACRAATLILFETAPRIACTLLDLAEALGLREAAICRELTKLHEEVRRGDLATLARHCAEQAQMRGEMVIVVAPPQRLEAMGVGELDTLLRAALDRGSLKEAVEEIVASTGESRRMIYQRALTLRAGRA